MTTTPPTPLRLTTVDTEDTVRIELHGDLDHDNADHLLHAVTGKLAEHPRLDDLHLHCSGLDVVDSMGLSILLMIRRRTGAAGVRLHLDDRTAKLDRLLTLTGTLDHLTAPLPGDVNSPLGSTAEPPMTSGEATSARPTGPHRTT
ncbi:STAS domain-containing protein [Streptomyces durmitorensis]|uniref:STAS domain-containing protein n=1 Tax=Streptomyces durmitorensis TaxID=319947 RepID=A0ABY4Q6T9_9ACTN|nr:STAS domain-containing protein [Streptomyces durmitorensis]UQT60861.1 STAS domain-containing protein [Streptomyces durmitorensis]